MTEAKVVHQDQFIQKLSNILGREMPASLERPAYQNAPQLDVFKDLSQDELVMELQKQAERNLTGVTVTTATLLPQVLKEKLAEFGEGQTIIWDDERYEQFGLTEVLKDAYKWDVSKGKQNISVADKALNAVAFSDITMAETAAVVHYHNAKHGRTFSFLPENYIVIVPKSTIVPRMTQATKIIHDQISAGKLVPSCINFICGPSNSADIELNKVVGVHGPVRSAYIVVEDK